MLYTVDEVVEGLVNIKPDIRCTKEGADCTEESMWKLVETILADHEKERERNAKVENLRAGAKGPGVCGAHQAQDGA